MIYTPSDDSFLLEKQVRKFVKGKSFLDMGAGSGIQTRAAIQAGAKSTLALDNNQEVIFLLKQESLPVIKSNLFSKVNGKFDIIAFNPPYLPADKREPLDSKKITTGGKKGDEIIIRFLKEAKSHLNSSGFILLVISSLTPKKKILQILNQKKLRKSILSKKKFFMETLEVWKISRQ